jgi:cysteine desulfurase
VAPVDHDGLVDLDGLTRLLDRDVSLVSVQLANHETGIVQPLAGVAKRVRRSAPKALLHTDAVAAAPWLQLALSAGAADLVSISAHKFGGPQGAGALATRGRPAMRATVYGGGQERELRSGTHNVAGIVGMAAAARAMSDQMPVAVERVGELRDRLAVSLRAALTDFVETAATSERLPGHLHLRIAGAESEALLVLLDDQGVCASAGAACASGAMEPSPILLAMGVPKAEALTSLRLSLGASTTSTEVALAESVIPAAVARLRGF